jgi:hypothetical protein
MNQYEIRVLRHDNQPLVISSRFLGDFHAIRRGQAMAQEDEGVEIWRGMNCLYRREPLTIRHAPAREFQRAPGAGGAEWTSGNIL